MQELVIAIRDPERKSFLLELLSQLDYIEVIEDRVQEKKADSYSFFDSVGLFAGREIDTDQLRRAAWTRR
jgi:hypothetical protein